MIKRLAILFLALGSWLLVFSQETVIVGDVTCAETGEPIPNANIYYQASSVGTSSNEEGSFVIKSDFSKKRVLVVSAVGYRTQRFQVEPGIMAGIQVALSEKTSVLEEVYATPDDSYALALLARVKKNKPVTDNRTSSASPVTQTKELYVSDIGSRQLKRRLWKSLQSGMITTEDSTLMMPLYVSRQTGDQKDERSIIMSPTDYSALLGSNNNLNFYNNTVSVLDRAFLSPLASASNTYYKYYLADSVTTDAGKQYILHFRTKNPYYATFNGEMTIDSATSTLRAITASVPPQTSVNYLKSVHVNQTLADDNSILSEQVTSILDFGVKTQDTHVFPTILLRTTTNAEGVDTSSITNHQSSIAKVDTTLATLDSLPLVRFAQWTATIINTGYIPTGTFLDIGNIQEILQVNDHEKVHVGLPFRTNEKLMKHVSLEASVGYGFRDRAFKGMGRINVQLPTPRRHVFFFEYQDHYVWTEVDDFSRLLRENGIGFKTMDFTAYAFEALHNNPNIVNTATRQRQFQLHFDNDWTDNIETQLYVRVGWMGYGDPLVGYHNIPSIPYQTVGGILRVGFRERKIDGYFSRYHVYSHLPVIYFGFEAGSYKTADMARYQMFAKLQLLLRHKADLGLGGTLDYAFQAGIIFGSVPYPFLHHFEGNQGYAYDPFRFTLMNNFQYAADKYLALHAEWNGQGILFNLIPGIRYLRLRELVTFKLAYGGLSNTIAPLCKAAPLTIPYAELGCGIGNIFRVLDLYSVWRLTNRDDIAAPLWALRFRLHISL
ncbi:MAG: carboxypeptidase-like regulatory domain-containing protein [Paludibacteraceae bacterium]|nr:carboxypeptidase-like regulatory domain-containing protein [Paludibacteraceae bacterium]